jgi:hypothetical protein
VGAPTRALVRRGPERERRRLKRKCEGRLGETQPRTAQLNALGAGAMLEPMMTLKAHVRNGQLVLDQAAELPEGAPAEVRIDVAELVDENMDEQERAALEEAIEDGLADADAGRVVDASVVLEKLRARSRG